MLPPNTQPKFKTDTYYIPLADGVYLRGNNNHLMLKGKSLYPLLKHLLPYFNGNATLEEITEGLDADKKKMVSKLIEKLLNHHFLQDTSQDQFHMLLPPELATYALDIAFIESFQTSAAYRFEGFRNKRLLLIGSRLCFTSLVQASLQCGVKQIGVVATSDGEIGPHFHPAMPGAFATCDSATTVQLRDSLHWDEENEVLNAIQSYDAIVHIAEQPMLERAQLLNKLCVEQQKAFIQAIVVDDHAWVGPLVCPETEGCWECAWRRLQANLPNSEQLLHYEFHDQPQVSVSRFPAMPVATMIAQRLIFELFRYFTHTGATTTARTLSTIDLKTFLSEGHTFLPHPHCLACQHPVVPTASQFLEQIQQLQHQGPIDLDTFQENFTNCVDSKLGLFPAIDDGHFVQAPLAVLRVHLPNLLLRKSRTEPSSVVAASIDRVGARLHIFQEACERYASNLVDQRRLLSPKAVQQQALPIISTDRLIGTQPPPTETEAWTWALDLQTQQTYLVPVAQAFSSLHNQEQVAESKRGIASGMTWEEAICQALLDWCNYLTVEQLKNARHAYAQTDLARAPMTPEGAYLHQLFKSAGEQITVYDITGALQVPTFAICLGARIVAYSTHCDVAQALRIGLEQAVRQYQSEQFHQPEYAVASVPDFPLTLRGTQLSVPHSTFPNAWPARQTWLQLQLQASGLRALVIPLNHDPSLVQLLPYVVRVLLTRAELKRGG